MIEAWRYRCNAVSPHSSLDDLTPHEFKQHNQPTLYRAALQE